MNLLSIAVAAAALAAVPGDDVVNLFEEHTYNYTGGEYRDEAFRYRLLKPETIEPGKKYPLVLFLHGAGERGDDNRSQLQYLPEWLATPEARRKYPCFLVVPQCRAGKWWVNRRRTPADPEPPAGPADQMRAVEGILQHVEATYPIDPRRVYLTGLSMGGYGSWDLATRQPERFAAVVPICGGGDPAKVAALVDVPVWAFHGLDDRVVPPARSREMIEALRAAGGKPKYTELEGVGHDSWTPAYDDASGLLAWMFEQVNDRRK